MTRRAAVIEPVAVPGGTAYADATYFGNQFMVLDAVGRVDIIALNQSGEELANLVGIPAGLIVKVRGGYTRLQVRAAVGQTVNIVHADEGVDLAGIVGTVTVTALAPNTITPATKAVGLVATSITAPAGTKSVTLQAKSTNTGVIWVGGVVGSGFEMPAGTPLSFDLDAGTVIALIADAAAQNLNITWAIRA